MLLCISILFANLWQGQFDLSCVPPLDFPHPSIDQRIKTTTEKLLRLQTAVIVNLILKTLFRQQTTVNWAFLKAFSHWSPPAFPKISIHILLDHFLMHLIPDNLPLHNSQTKAKTISISILPWEVTLPYKHNIWNTTLFYLSTWHSPAALVTCSVIQNTAGENTCALYTDECIPNEQITLIYIW